MIRAIDLVKKYIRTLRRDARLAERTIISYESDLLSFIKSVGEDKEMHQISEIDIERFFTSVEGFQKLSESSIVRKASAVRGFYNYLEFNNIIIRSPIKRIPLKSIRRIPKPVLMSREETHLFFKTIEDELRRLKHLGKKRLERGDPDSMIQYRIFCNTRNHLIFSLILTTGLKPGELSELTNDQITIKQKKIEFNVYSKYERKIAISDSHSQKLLKDYLRNIKESGFKSSYFFFNKNMGRLSTVMIQKIFRDYLAKSGISRPLTPISLRHAFAVNLINQNVDMNVLRQSLGYKTFEGLLIYHSYFSSKKNNERRVKNNSTANSS
ncbi:tyrosine-type recombinase/integrase [candidate division KSB1 bacterium]